MDDRYEGELTGIVARLESWIKDLARDCVGVRDVPGVAELETRVREGGRAFQAQLLEVLLNKAAAANQEECRTCPCQSRRRHKGERGRTIVTTVGAVRVKGVLFRCPSCGMTASPVDRLTESVFSPEMERMLCLLGTALASFEKGSEACRRLLGVEVSADSIIRVCRRHGFRLMRQKTSFIPFDTTEVVKGGIDGTMVNTREDRWREIKAYRFESDSGASAGGASLRRIERFERALERTGRALCVHPKRAVFVTDAALWIERVVRERFPGALHIVDYWHACQHIHAAAKEMFGEKSWRAASWGETWSRTLREQGGEETLNRLQRFGPGQPEHEYLRPLRRYLYNNKSRMNYPEYERRGLPISSGSMESFCKQLGQRLKGPGMRWRCRNVDPMAALVSHWTLNQWDSAWTDAA